MSGSTLFLPSSLCSFLLSGSAPLTGRQCGKHTSRSPLCSTVTYFYHIPFIISCFFRAPRTFNYAYLHRRTHTARTSEISHIYGTVAMLLSQATTRRLHHFFQYSWVVVALDPTPTLYPNSWFRAYNTRCLSVNLAIHCKEHKNTHIGTHSVLFNHVF